MTITADFQLDQAAAVEAIARQLALSERQVQSAIELLDAGNTVPFIARYRKEATQGLDEVALRAIEDALERCRNLAARKSTILKSILEQGLLTASLRQQIIDCDDSVTLEAIYLPFKPRRRTRATIAREQGLQPLADLLAAQTALPDSKAKTLAAFVDPSRDVPDAATALQGALDIIAEQWSENLNARQWLLQHAHQRGRVTSQVKRGKQAEASKFESYVDRREPVSRIPSHRLLAMLRGETEGVLRVSVELEEAEAIRELGQRFVTNRQFPFYQELLRTVDDCYQRLLHPATQSTVLQNLKQQADEEAIQVFGKNLRELLMAAPAGPRVTLGIDPGFRTGCKLAVVDGTGKFLQHATIFPTPPRADVAGAARKLLELIDRYQIELIAIGNGTAARETDAFVKDLLNKHALPITRVMVSEAGASVYSASELAAKEFPELDLTIRGAISIARRLQDPLSELVKTDPKSIGVGQYQHDVNQPLLRKCLDRVVESCVNQVGVDVNMASVSLLSYVAGIGPKLAENIVQFRDSQGRFTNRQQLTKVPKLGPKAFEQAAGFLRIRDGDEPLDNSAVHPERYAVVAQMARDLNADVHTIVGKANLSRGLKPESYVSGDVGLPTIVDIIAELGKPGRDPRSEFRAVQFDDAITSLDDLKPGQILEAVITNVTHFGAFADIGVHQDGLIHISQLSQSFVSDPNSIVAVGDIVRVKVLEVDAERKRISLSCKL